MVARLSTNRDRLYQLLGVIGEKEPFVKLLVHISKRAHSLGGHLQRGTLGILRSDYMVDQDNQL